MSYELDSENSKTEGAYGEADIVVEILPTDAERARSRGSSSDLAHERGPSSPEERRSLTAVAWRTVLYFFSILVGDIDLILFVS